MQQSVGVVDVNQLKEHTADVLRRVDEDRETIDVADGDRVVARLIPVSSPVSSDVHQAIWQRRRKLAEAIGRRWTDDVSAATEISEGRRTL
jgi:antitoxin (DNA-binding transcriptional repressor) of toxin-antitoxin stability system